MEKVESFKLYHTTVKAPDVRKCCVLDGKNGDKVTKFDLRFKFYLRFLHTNEDAFVTDALHWIEHLLATYLRETIEDILDLSPMVCRTGYSLIMWGDL